MKSAVLIVFVIGTLLWLTLLSIQMSVKQGTLPESHHRWIGEQLTDHGDVIGYLLEKENARGDKIE